jgi:hypothetical protein
MEWSRGALGTPKRTISANRTQASTPEPHKNSAQWPLKCWPGNENLAQHPFGSQNRLDETPSRPTLLRLRPFRGNIPRVDTAPHFWSRGGPLSRRRRSGSSPSSPAVVCGGDLAEWPDPGKARSKQGTIAVRFGADGVEHALKLFG